MTAKVRRAFTAVLVFFLSTALASAADRPARETGAPPALEKWKDWVLHEAEDQLCPPQYNDGRNLRCAWPTKLELTLEARQGRFRQVWLVLAKTWAPLPGSPGAWPIQVEVDGERTPVIPRSGAPMVWLTPGEHRLEGSFEWSEMPEMIQVPASTGLVSLSLNGKAVEFPVLDAAGRLWLQRRAAVQAGEDRLEVRLQRLINDSIPVQVTNLIKLNVSGRAREIRLEGLLLPEAVPTSLTSPLPARLGPEGDLKIQVRPGRHEIQIVTRQPGPVKQFGPIKAPFGQETWAFQSQNHLRLVKITGVPAVDPSQTDLPDRWKSLPTYLMDPEAKMVFEEIRRGDPDPAPDRLTLSRTWWLDFDGQGFTTQDKITGAMSRQWHLAMNPPGALGRVSVDGRDQLITRQTGGKAGVELRRGQLNLAAEARYGFTGGTIPAVGWDHDFQSVSAQLHLPPGWRLLTATGVDVLPGTWFERWTLLDLFLVLIISLAVFKLTGWRWGLLALIALGLSYHEAGAPQLVWISLLAAQALLKVLPEGWFKKLVQVWRLASIVALLVIALPFMVEQVRIGVYPQLEQLVRYGPRGILAGLGGAPMTAYKMDALVDEEKEETGRLEEKKAPRMKAKALERPAPSKPQPPQEVQQYYRKQAALTLDPNALIQTGPGLPKWHWRSVNMKWNGPVDRTQEIRLWLLSPRANLALAMLRVILLVLLIVALLDLKQWWRRLDKRTAVPAAAVLVWLLTAGSGLAQNQSQAVNRQLEPAPNQQMMNVAPNVNAPYQQAVSPALNQPPAGPKGPAATACYPAPEILDELKRRLLRKPECLPGCAHYPRLAVTALAEALTLRLELHAAADTAVPLPGKAESWLPRQVLLDDQPAQGLLRDKDGILWLMTPRGLHTLTLIGPTPPGNSFQVPLPLRPDKVQINGDGWEVLGVRPDGQVEAGLRFNRLKKDGRQEQVLETTALPPFLHVERVLILGLTWEVETKVTRLTPPGSSIVVSIPLLPGESITSAGVTMEQGRALLNMDPKATEATWTSTLEPTEEIQLQAPEGEPWTETWVLDASPIWHCELKGLSVIHHQDAQGHWRPEWRPWPGEKVNIKISRPKAIPGQTLTVESTELAITPGERFNKAALTLNIRASQGGQHRLTLPEGAKLQLVKINERTQPIGQENRQVVLPLQPGAQKAYVEWHEQASPAAWLRGPEVKIGDQAVNASVTFNVPRNRWILFTWGPRLGPAVLFWSYLAIVVLAALVLGRVNLTPLRGRHWLLLGLGLTQIHPLLAIVIIGWLLVLARREKQAPSQNWFLFDLAQVGLVVWTVVALIGLYWAVREGLLGIPQMQVSGNESSDYVLHWTQDRIGPLLPQPWVLSLPKWLYRGLMLLWALWMALSLLKWLRWGWFAFGQEGLWRWPPRRDKKKPEAGPNKPGGDDFVIESS
ncbi:MAG: hypothetical protein AB1641_27835 [Thermodesulfobacteriota bacterium]